jgi:hypothetical protein
MASRAGKIVQWTNRFKRFRKSNTTVTQFCRDERVTVQAFYYWRERVSICNSSEDQLAGAVARSVAQPGAVSTHQAESLDQKPLVRFTIQVGEIAIQCESTSLQVVELLLRSVSSGQASGRVSAFQQLV